MSASKSPFKANDELRKLIGGFLKKHGATFAQEAKKTSAFFEIAAYNDLVRFYENNGYKIRPKNLKSRQFVYAMSPNAKPSSCSYFSATKKYKSGKIFCFEIRHNLRIQSAHDPEVFISPDYAVIDQGSIQSIKLSYYYNGKADYFYVPATAVRTFAETKHYNPSPELVINFIGLVNEIKPASLGNTMPSSPPKHCAPSLFVSGVGSVHVEKIKESLSGRYQVNVFLGLFAFPSQVYSANNQINVKKVGTS